MNLKSFWYVFFILVTLVLVVASILRLITPPSSIPDSDFFSTDGSLQATNFDTITITLPQEKIPNMLDVYTVTLETPANRYISQIIEQYNLTQHQTLPTLWVGSDYSLRYDSTNAKLTLSESEFDFEYEPEQIQSEQAIALAEKTLKDLFPSLLLQPDRTAIEYHGYELDLYNTIPQSEAVIARIPFIFQFTQYPVFLDKNSVTSPIVITTTNDRILKIDIQLVAVTPTNTLSLPSLTQAEVQANIENNRGFVVSAYSDEMIEPDLSTVRGGTFTFVGIEYRLNPQSQQLIPFYTFEGNTSDAGGSDILTTIATPAIAVR